MTKVIITGATGFIGKNLVTQLHNTGHEVVEVNSKSGDVADDLTWLRFPQAEVVIHLAGRSYVPDSWNEPTQFIKCNLLGTVAALNYCRKNNARFVFLSSYLYGNPKSLPISETSALFANNPYALSKKLAEEACSFYAESFGIVITILRPFNVYGPGQPENFLVPSIIRQVLGGKLIRVNDLEPRRDYVYVDDVVQAIIKAVHCTHKFNIYNIGTGVSHSVEELIQIIQDINHTHLPVYSDLERRKDEIMNTVADITKAKLQLGWTPKWTLAQGLKQMAEQDN